MRSQANFAIMRDLQIITEFALAIKHDPGSSVDRAA